MNLLVEEHKTILYTSSEEIIIVLSAVHQYLGANNLLLIELSTFDRNRSFWHEFIQIKTI